MAKNLLNRRTEDRIAKIIAQCNEMHSLRYDSTPDRIEAAFLGTGYCLKSDGLRSVRRIPIKFQKAASFNPIILRN